MAIRVPRWRSREFTVQAFDLRGVDAGADVQASITLMRLDGNRAAALYGPDGVVSGVTVSTQFGPQNAVNPRGGTEEVGVAVFRLLPNAAYTPDTQYVLTVAGRRYVFTMPDEDTDLLTVLGAPAPTPDPGGGGGDNPPPVDPTPQHEFVHWHSLSRTAVSIPSNAVRETYAEPQSWTIGRWSGSQYLLFAWETELGQTLDGLSVGGFPQAAAFQRVNTPIHASDGKTWTYWHSENSLDGAVVGGTSVVLTRVRG